MIEETKEEDDERDPDFDLWATNNNEPNSIGQIIHSSDKNAETLLSF